VEVHGANGYLLDQFLQDKTNHSTASMAAPLKTGRGLLLEVTDAVYLCLGERGRVGVHLAPRGDSQDMGDSNSLATFGLRCARAWAAGNRLYLCPRRIAPAAGRIGPQLKAAFGGRLHRQLRNLRWRRATIMSWKRAKPMLLPLAFSTLPTLICAPVLP